MQRTQMLGSFKVMEYCLASLRQFDDMTKSSNLKFWPQVADHQIVASVINNHMHKLAKVVSHCYF